MRYVRVSEPSEQSQDCRRFVSREGSGRDAWWEKTDVSILRCEMLARAQLVCKKPNNPPPPRNNIFPPDVGEDHYFFLHRC